MWTEMKSIGLPYYVSTIFTLSSLYQYLRVTVECHPHWQYYLVGMIQHFSISTSTSIYFSHGLILIYIFLNAISYNLQQQQLKNKGIWCNISSRRSDGAVGQELPSFPLHTINTIHINVMPKVTRFLVLRFVVWLIQIDLHALSLKCVC